MTRWRRIMTASRAYVQSRIEVLFPLVLLVLCYAAYGLLIPNLGFYWDDWPMVWFLEALGPEGFHQVWAMDRPMIAPLFQMTTALLGAIPWRWHLFALLTRWFSLICFYWALGELWPEQKQRSRWIILLFAIYPGFQQQSIALIYSHYFLILGLIGISWATMLAALHRKPAWVWSLVSILTGAFSLFSMEFFIGLELARPLVLWIGWKRTHRDRGRRGGWILHLVPYAVVWITYAFWRTEAVGFRAYQPVLLENLRSAPLDAIGSLFVTAWTDLFEAGVQAWWRALIPPSFATFGRLGSTATILVAGAAGILVFVFLFLAQETNDTESKNGQRWAIEAASVGLGSILLGGWAFWVPALDLALFFPWDRFTLGWMLGIGMLWVALLDGLLPRTWLKVAAIAVLVAAGVSAQVQAAITFQRAWEAEQRFFWNVAWRIPDLESGTLLLTNEFPMDFVTDNSLTGVINLMYANEYETAEMPFLMFDLDTRLGHGLSGLETDLPVERVYRATTFSGSTSQALLLYYAPPGCLRVVDQVLDDSSPTLPGVMHEAIHLSRLDLIDTEGAPSGELAEILMGPEPVDTWCYYFEHADLARQQGDWEDIAVLGDIAFQLEDHPNLAEERIPFIEGYAHVGQLERAITLTWEALEHSAGVRRPLCHAWERIAESVDLDDDGWTLVDGILIELGCEP